MASQGRGEHYHQANLQHHNRMRTNVCLVAIYRLLTTFRVLRHFLAPIGMQSPFPGSHSWNRNNGQVGEVSTLQHGQFHERPNQSDVHPVRRQHSSCCNNAHRMNFTAINKACLSPL